MQNDYQPYSDPANLEAILMISRDVVHSIEPEEDISVKRLGGRLVKACEEGRLTIAGNDAENAGGFGDIDLVTLVVVPLIVTTFGEVGKQLATWGVGELKKWANKHKDNKKKLSELIEIVVEQKYEEVNGKVKSKKSHSKKNIVLSSVKVYIKKYLELND